MFISDPQLLPSALGKAERTRQRILSSALTLFASIGYEHATLRQIAAGAGTSLGLTYRYFSCKEELVLAFYNGLASRFIEHVQQIPFGTLADRFEAAMLYKLALIEPHQDLIGVLLSSALNPKSPIGVLGEQTADIRRRMQVAFEQIVKGSQDAPPGALAQRLATLLYMTQRGRKSHAWLDRPCKVGPRVLSICSANPDRFRWYGKTRGHFCGRPWRKQQ